MNGFVVLFVACVATASASWIGGGHGGILAPIAINPAAHIPSGSVGVSAHGAVVAGPAGSVATDNGLGGHGAGARLSGPSGDVRTHGGAVQLTGPGNGHGGGWADGGWGGGVGVVGVGLGGLGGWGGHGAWDGEDDGQWRGDHGWDGDNGQWHGDLGHGGW